jgi:hypothetical protein
MWWPVSGAMNAEKEIKEANYPLIRLLQVPLKPPLSSNGMWNASGKSVLPKQLRISPPLPISSRGSFIKSSMFP